MYLHACLLLIILLFNIDRPRFSIENKDVQYGKYGESTKLEFYVYSFSVKEFVLTNLEGRHYNICGLNITVDKIMVKFYQKFIHVNGYKITLDTKILTDLDFRKYNVIVRNSYGEDVFNFTLQPASKYIYVIINSLSNYLNTNNDKCLNAYITLYVL